MGPFSPLTGKNGWPEKARGPRNCGTLEASHDPSDAGGYGWPAAIPPASSSIFSEMIPMRSTPAPRAMSIAWTTLP